MLRRVFYVSEISERTTDTDVRSIVSSSLVWNRRHDVTGLLVATRTNFAQVLEARAEDMALVLARIRSDPHHHDMHFQLDDMATKRLFEGWAMAYAQRFDLSDDLARLHAGDAPGLDPARLLETLAASANETLPRF